MDSRTGDLYETRKDAIEAGVPEEAIVEIRGPKKAIEKVAGRVRWAAQHEERKRKARRRAQKASRKANRGR